MAQVRGEKRRRLAVLDAPTDLGLKPSGVDRLAGALRETGLVEQLGATYAGEVRALPYDAARDPETKLLNSAGIRDYVTRLADAVGGLLDQGDIPIVLGGDDSILLGCALANRRRGRRGLVFIDGHTDFYPPELSPTGETSDSDFALATGRGPAVLANIEGLSPLVRDEDAAALGHRDADEQREYGSPDARTTAITVLDLAEMRERGMAQSAVDALNVVAKAETQGFWIHIDADVLDDAVMPAVDYRMPDGLSPDELANLLQALLGSGRALGLSLSIYNPALDPDGSAGRVLAGVLVKAFAP
jgi:arginase